MGIWPEKAKKLKKEKDDGGGGEVGEASSQFGGSHLIAGRTGNTGPARGR